MRGDAPGEEEAVIKVIATPVDWKRTQKKWTFETLPSAVSALELIKESPAFDCIKIEHPEGWQQVERDTNGAWEVVHDYNPQRDNRGGG